MESRSLWIGNIHEYRRRPNDPACIATIHVQPQSFLWLDGSSIAVETPWQNDRRILGCGFNNHQQSFAIVVESAAFDPVEVGDLVPTKSIRFSVNWVGQETDPEC